jgi:sugar fermentation stimulation protein A
MQFPSPLLRGALVSRYKRFFADVVLEDGTEVTAHCPNPGAMLGLNTPGLPCFLSTSDDPKRKLRHTLELVEVDGGLVGINTPPSPRKTKSSGRRAFV